MPNRILVIFAHPVLEKSRVNRMLLKRYSGLQNVTVSDIYDKYPDFNIDTEAEKQLLMNCDIIILHHPLYWYSCPPLMKQWIDLVLEAGWAYGTGGNALRGKRFIQVVTSGGAKFAYSHDGGNRYTLRDFLRPFEQTATLCKMQYLPPFVVHGTHRLSKEEILSYSNLLSDTLLALSLLQEAESDLTSYEYFNDLIEERRTL